MAILKDLIVHGSSRFLNKIYASEIQTPLIEAEAGIIKKLKADDATVVGLLDVKGQLHTNSWSNSNIATIDGSFYITPTIGSASGTVSITSSSLVFSGTNYAVSSLYLGDGSSITWPQYSKVLVTGQILSNGEWIPLGTLLGQLSSIATAASISINNIKDNKNQTSNVLATLVSNGTTSSNYRNLKVSLYQRATSSTDFRPLGIYMTATGTNGRTFLDIYGGVESLSTNNNYGGFAEPNVRIGNLQGLPNVGGQTPSGWGIYTDNGYFKGIIAADQGYIGSGSKYWIIANEEDLSNSENSRSYIYNGTNNIASTVEGIYLGTDGIRNYKNSTHFVTIQNGVINAKGVNLTGQITATSGIIGGWNIGTDTNKSLYYGNQTPGATTTNLVLSPTSAVNSNAIGGSGTGLNWFLSAGKVFGVTTAGALYATSGKIGGWTIDGNSLTMGAWGTENSAMICTGSGSPKSIGGSEATVNGWIFTAGANFGVTKTGVLYASSANISGKITATSGEIGGITIDDNGKLWITDANISGTINSSHIDVSSINIGNLSGEIGGRNLIINTLNPDATAANRPKFLEQTVNTAGRGTASVAEHGIRFTTTSAAYCYIYMGFTAISNGTGATLQGLTAGKTYTFSCDFTCKLLSADTSTIIRSLRFSLYDDTSGSFALDKYQDMIDLDASKKGTEQSGYFYYTFTLPTNITKFGFMIRTTVTTNNLFQTGDFIELRNIKLEEGNKATKWSPASEDVIKEGGKTATSYITQIDDTGIKITPYDQSGNDYLQINSDAISMYRNNIETLKIRDSAIRIGKVGEGQKNVYIDSDSINIRNNENVLASFTGEDIKFYDGGIEELEIASFGGANGVRIGSESEIHFVIKNDGIKAQNDNGSPIFSIETTEGTVGNIEKIANPGTVSTNYRTISIENLTSNSTFYTEQIRLMLEIIISNNDLEGVVSSTHLQFSSFKVNNEENEIVLLSFQDNNNGRAGARWRFITYLSTKDYSFIFGTSKTVTLSLEGVLRHPNTNGEIITSTLQRDISIIYDGNNQITFTPCFTSTSPFNNGSPLHLVLGDTHTYYTYDSIMSYNTNSKAPALTFGTRLGTIGPLSTVIGEALYAPNRGQMTIGKFNYGTDTQTSLYSFIVGNGQSGTDRSNAFTVDQNGNVGIQGKIHNIIISGNTETKLPLFYFGSKTWTISSIGANRAWYCENNDPDINVAGYTPVAIAGYSVWGGTNGGWCVVPRVYIDQHGTDTWGNPTPARLQGYVWNQGSQAATNIKFTVEILYIANNFID